MDTNIVVPLAFFACVTCALKAVLDAALRYRLLHATITDLGRVRAKVTLTRSQT